MSTFTLPTGAPGAGGVTSIGCGSISPAAILLASLARVRKATSGAGGEPGICVSFAIAYMIANMSIKGILFDWDGVIVDSMPNLAKGMQKVASTYGVEISVDFILENYFQPREAFYKSIGVETEDVAELIRVHLDMMQKAHLEEALPFPGAIDSLMVLAGKFTLGVVSANQKERVVAKLLEFKLDRQIVSEYVIGGEEAKEEKLDIASQVFGCDKKNLLYVGDLPSDVQAAKAVGMKSAGIAQSEAAMARLGKENPDYLISSLNELEEKINETRN